MVVAFCCLFFTFDAHAGVPECGNVRIEADAACSLEVAVSCEGACRADVYKKACATQLRQSCSTTCTADVTEVCFGSAEEQCFDQCAVTDLTCHDGCFDECAGGCQAQCAGAGDPSQCRATCEANCDGECDSTCGALPTSSSCYDHCIECYRGACRAEVNFDCQYSCQEVEFETCEHELQIDCDTSCSGQGALFCDGEYILGGEDVVPCIEALIEMGVDAAPEILDQVSRQPLEIEPDVVVCGLEGEEDCPTLEANRAGCLCSAGSGGPGTGGPAGLAVMLWFFIRRRRKAA